MRNIEKVTIIEQIKIIKDIIFSPTKAFKKINRKPKWLIVFLTIGVGTMIISYLTLPFVVQVATLSIPPDISPNEAENVLNTMKPMRVIGIFLSPLFLLIGFLIIAVILWLIVQLFSEVDFKRIFSIVVHCGIITFLGSVLTLIILQLRGLRSIKSAADVQVSLGLDIFLRNPDLSLAFKTFLSNINVFSIWWIVLITLGISITSKISKTKSAFIAIFFWLFSTAIQIGLASLTGSLGKIG
ncbi:MAG: YIP1 family protein [Candidatus Aminicenantia bacterium]